MKTRSALRSRVSLRSRAAVFVVAGTLLAAPIAVGPVSGASAADRFITPGDISNDPSAVGWHESIANSQPTPCAGEFELDFGIGADSRVMNALVPAGKPGVAITADQLSPDVIDNSFVDMNLGETTRQLDVSTAATKASSATVIGVERGDIRFSFTTAVPAPARAAILPDTGAKLGVAALATGLALVLAGIVAVMVSHRRPPRRRATFRKVGV